MACQTENSNLINYCQAEGPWDTIIVNQIPMKIDHDKFMSLFSQHGDIESHYFCKENPRTGEKHERLAKLKFSKEEDARKVLKASRKKLIKYDDTVLMITLSSNDYSPIQNLPDICLREIFHRVHVKDRFNLEMVCKRWKENARCCWSSITDIATSDWIRPDWSIKTWRVILSRIGDSLKTVRWHLTNGEHEYIAAVAERCIHLRRMISIIIQMDQQLYAPLLRTILLKNNNLRQVQLYFEQNRFFDVDFMDVLPADLEEIELCIAPQLFLWPPVARFRLKKLRILVLHGFDITDHESIDSIENLERLSLKNCKISEESFSKILGNNVGLKHLHLDCNYLHESWFTYVQRLPQLQVLVVKEEKLTDTYLSLTPRLRGLYCAQCKLITDEGIRNLLIPAENIQKLWILNCSITITSLEIARNWTERTGQFLQIFPNISIYEEYGNRTQGEPVSPQAEKLRVITWDPEEPIGYAEGEWGLKLLG